MSRAAKVILVDDDESVRKATGRLLKSEGYEVVAYASAEELLKESALNSAGCLLLDYHMPGVNGFELQETLIAKGCPTPIIFITGHGDIPMSVKAMKRGAMDFLTKPFKAEELRAAVDKAFKKSSELHKAAGQRKKIEHLFEALTPAEHQVMRWVITGMLNKQIAGKLGISEKTVKAHRGRVMHKTQVTSVAELVYLTQKANIIPANQ